MTGLSIAKLHIGPEFDSRLQSAISSSYTTARHITVPQGSKPELVLSISTSVMDDASHAKVGSICLLRDISEQSRNDELVRHAQKIESLGLMAGGVAHDFNNILTAIIGNLELAIMKLGVDSPALPYLNEVTQSSHRAADLANKILTYTGGAHIERKELDLNIAVQDALALLESELPKEITIDLTLSQKPLKFLGDRRQIHEMLVNLITNSYESLAKHGSTISVYTDQIDVDRQLLSEAQIGQSMPPGSYARVTITDDGEGMDGEMIKKIFDPFFSTRFVGRGLGLAAVSGAVKGHFAILKLTSHLGQGSSFTVLLPMATEGSSRPIE